MTSLSVPQSPAGTADGLRPINLRTDLAPLADLMELVFADSMDAGGRSAISEMRTFSRLGAGLGLLAQINELALGIRLGYVWIADGRLVGNVSVYPANWPAQLGYTWIIANVGVHPDYRRQGIARRLMQASMDMIRQQDGQRAVLQVDDDNTGARRLYENLGFVDERAWITWRRGSAGRVPPPVSSDPVFITRRTGREWQAEYALAQRLRPLERGGLGWQRPLHFGLFHRPFIRRLADWLSLRSTERLVIRSDDGQRIDAALWIESGFALSSVELTLMVEPAYQGLYDDALIGTAARRFEGVVLIIEHPKDEIVTGQLLEHYRFVPRRTVMHMRWDVT